MSVASADVGHGKKRISRREFCYMVLAGGSVLSGATVLGCDLRQLYCTIRDKYWRLLKGIFIKEVANEPHHMHGENPVHILELEGEDGPLYCKVQVHACEPDNGHRTVAVRLSISKEHFSNPKVSAAIQQNQGTVHRADSASCSSGFCSAGTLGSNLPNSFVSPNLLDSSMQPTNPLVNSTTPAGAQPVGPEPIERKGNSIMIQRVGSPMIGVYEGGLDEECRRALLKYLERYQREHDAQQVNASDVAENFLRAWTVTSWPSREEYESLLYMVADFLYARGMQRVALVQQ